MRILRNGGVGLCPSGLLKKRTAGRPDPLQRAKGLIRSGDLNGAKKVLGPAAAKRQCNSELNCALARLLSRQGEYLAALKVIDRALAAQASEVEVVRLTCNKIKILFRTGADRAECAQLLFQAVKADNFHPDSLSVLMAGLSDLGVSEKARTPLSLIIKYKDSVTVEEFETGFLKQLTEDLAQSRYISPELRDVALKLEYANRKLRAPSITKKRIHQAAARIRELHPGDIKRAVELGLVESKDLDRLYSIMMAQDPSKRGQMVRVFWPAIEPAVNILKSAMDSLRDAW